MRLLIYILTLVTAALANKSVVISDVDACKFLLQQDPMLSENSTIEVLDGIVGVGWDDLMNRATIPILKNTYKNCNRVQDGRFFIPDNVLTVPILQTSLDRMANVYTSFKEYCKQTTNTITVGGGGVFRRLSVSGSFSYNHQVTKNTFFRQKSTMLHSKMIHHAYTLITDGSAGLNDGFVARLQQIIDTVDNGNYPQAKRLAELIVRDYGTHIVFKADVGAVIEQETYINSTTDYSSKTTLDALRASASVSFLNVGHASIDAGHSVTEADKQVLSNIIHHSRIRSRGGPNVNRLSDGKGIFVIDDLVSFTNEGIPLDTIIMKANLPTIDAGKIYNLQELIRNAINEYYERNTIRGCTNMTSPNFVYQANFDDNSCVKSNMTYPFSGVVQKCTPISEAAGSHNVMTTPSWRCDNLVQVNPMTKDFTCQENYEAVPITSIVHQFPDRTEQRSYVKCHNILFIRRCHTVYYTVIMKDRVKIDSFWCRGKSGAKLPPNSGSMFGGLYTNNSINIFTGSASCPAAYVGYRLFTDATVCISYDYQIGVQHMIPFDGFFSCQSAQQKCGEGFTQHLVEIFDNCAVFYCVSPEAYLSLEDPVINRPPYTDAVLAASNYAENTVLAYFNEEQVVDVPVSYITQDHIQQLESKTGGVANKKMFFAANDVQHIIDNYMNHTSEEILDLIEKYPNKTWGEIEKLLSAPPSSESSIFKSPGFICTSSV
ncbi:hypothetical protein FO519_009359 [Halicephalobus sp. NKZ332]|nr:hypothetical protein FO519_009359 [Halicephalobus sp. NKZ332]